jgi:hypothetical protein
MFSFEHLVVRRAERGIALVVRQGQPVGAVRKQNDHDTTVNQHGPAVRDSGPCHNVTRTSPAEFYAHRREQIDAHDMADGVDDAAFEEALEESRAEGNLTRSNVAGESNTVVADTQVVRFGPPAPAPAHAAAPAPVQVTHLGHLLRLAGRYGRHRVRVTQMIHQVGEFHPPGEDHHRTRAEHREQIEVLPRLRRGITATLRPFRTWTESST